MSLFQNWLIQPIPCLYTLQNRRGYTNALAISKAYLITLPLAQNQVGSQSESSVKSPESSTNENQKLRHPGTVE